MIIKSLIILTHLARVKIDLGERDPYSALLSRVAQEGKETQI